MNNLQKFRKEKNMSQAELSREAGVNFRTIQHYELLSNDKLDTMRVATCLRLCNTLGCTMGELLASKDAIKHG